MGGDMRTDELREKVESKRERLEERLERLRANASADKADALMNVKDKLDELNQLLDGGWDGVGPQQAERLEDWLRTDETGRSAGEAGGRA